MAGIKTRKDDMMKSFIRTACILVLATSAAMAGESGIAVKADSLRDQPFQDGRVLAQIAKGERAEILKTSGGWSQVKTAKGSGWVRMLSIRRNAARSGATSGSSLSALASGRAGTGKIVATTGIRGLNEEELKAARYNESEVALAESYESSKTAARQFAQKGKLVAQPVEYLPASGAAK
jgi:uncharacterized protein YgiM (DUF1202 family)